MEVQISVFIPVFGLESPRVEFSGAYLLDLLCLILPLLCWSLTAWDSGM